MLTLKNVSLAGESWAMEEGKDGKSEQVAMAGVMTREPMHDHSRCYCNRLSFLNAFSLVTKRLRQG